MQAYGSTQGWRAPGREMLRAKTAVSRAMAMWE